MDPYYALAGHGEWVVLEGRRFFKPRAYVVDGQEWMPYRNGYWTWVEGDGQTWVSYDPWGWFTDHRGRWRHHADHGYVWTDGDDLSYRPHCVTWFYGDSHAGWYPYYAGFENGYAERGRFDDGFWGNQATFAVGGDGFSFHLGITMVRHEDLFQPNIANIVVNDVTVVNNVFNVSVVNNSYGPNPYGAATVAESRDAVSKKVGEDKVIASTTQKVTSASGVVHPAPVHAVPPVYTAVAKAQPPLKGPSPAVGSVIHVDSASGTTTLVPTTTNGHVVVPAPQVKDPKTGVVSALLPSKTSVPAVPNPSHPIAATQPVHQAVQPVHPVVQPGPHPAAQPGTHPAAQPGTHPAEKPVTQPAAKPVTHPEAQPGTHPAVQPATRPAAKPVIQPSGNRWLNRQRNLWLNRQRNPWLNRQRNLWLNRQRNL